MTIDASRQRIRMIIEIVQVRGTRIGYGPVSLSRSVVSDGSGR
jgi:hypothetical protein